MVGRHPEVRLVHRPIHLLFVVAEFFGGYLDRAHQHVRAVVIALLLVVLGAVPAATTASASELRDSTGAVAKIAVRPSLGCTTPAIFTGQRTLNFSAPEDDGSYIAQVPTSATAGRPLPLVFEFHGYNESGPAQAEATGLGTYGQAHGFITITPWVNGEPVPMWLSTVGSRDLTWFGQLLSHIEATTCVDENRVFVTGASNGAFMASAIACQYSALIAAVAPVSGIQTMRPCRTTRPVPVVTFHGTADPLVPYDGKASKLAADLPAPDGSDRRIDTQEEKQFGAKGVFQRGPSIPQEAAAWAERNGCMDAITTTKISSTVTLLSWQCRDHANVELYRIAGGGHTWPGSLGRTKIASKSQTRSLSGDAVIWQFFKAHPFSFSD